MERRLLRPIYTIALLGWIGLFVMVAAGAGLATERVDGDMLVRGTVRIALLYWGLAATGYLARKLFVARWMWTLGCIAYLIHVAFAFEYVHHWSHGEAFAHVERASGYGAGIFVSYTFTLLWTCDVLWAWLSPSTYEHRPKRIPQILHGFMVFVIFNATVIFESGWIRWVGASGLLVLGLLYLWRDRHSG